MKKSSKPTAKPANQKAEKENIKLAKPKEKSKVNFKAGAELAQKV
jgi:hypothetical protein